MTYWMQQANERKTQLTQMRRHIHRYPELGYKEVNTASYLAAALRKEKIDVREHVGGTGLVATITGGGPGRTIAFRADMDALPIHERNHRPYASEIPGISHACGHDAHCAILAQAAILLQRHRRRIAGSVKFIFQPAEECPPLGGARPMIEDGALANPKVDAIYGLHVTSNLPVGKVGVIDGLAMAASDQVEIKIIGSGGHGSAPQQGIDAILVAAHTVIALQSIVSRNVSPHKPAVVSVGVLKAGYRYNVIADTAFLDCTVRSLDTHTRQLVQDKIEQIVAGVTMAMGARYELRYTEGYPAGVNNSEQVRQIIMAAEAALGPASVKILKEPSLGGEDFAHFLKLVPGSMFWLGTRPVNAAKQYPLHHPSFDIDETALPYGVAMFCRIIEQELFR